MQGLKFLRKLPGSVGEYRTQKKMEKQKKRIMVVDDLASDTRLLKKYFQECHGYIVQEENDPASAMAAAEIFKPDLIILDLLMPVMDGVQLAGALRANKNLKAVPIVFLTAATTKEAVRAAGGRIGDFPFMAKPIHLGEVAAMVNQHLPM
jgi:DNA-binding response OmpR family regulator